MSYSQELGKEDLFGKFIADSTQNRADIGSQHDFNQERWRYNRRDSTSGPINREFIAYGETTGFTDTEDSYIIEPTSTDFIAQITTAEIFRYVVGYTSSYSFAFQTNQSLGTGDKVVVGIGDPDIENNMSSADGWFLEFEPSLADNECYFSIYRNGTIVSNGGSRTLVKLEKNVNDWRRFEIEFSWYNVGSAELTETFTGSEGKQSNPVQATISPGDGKGPLSPDKQITFSIRGGGNGTSLEVGSVGAVINGDVNELFRSKTERFQGTINNDDVWNPAFALRADPNVGDVQLNLRDITILRFTANSNALLVQANGMSKEKVTFDGTDSWSAPDAINSANSALQFREDINQFTDDTGTLVNTTNSPGGYQIFRSELSPTGKRFKEGTTSTSKVSEVIRRLLSDDILVVLIKSTTSNERFDLDYEIDETW